MRLFLMIAMGAIIGFVVSQIRGNGDRRDEGAHGPANTTVVGRGAVVQTPRTPSRVKQRELEATDVRYNPVLLSQESAGVTSPEEIFDAEPRDAVFAPVLEGRVKSSISAAAAELNISVKIKSVKTECKTLSCKSYVEVDAADLDAVYDELNGVMLGDVQVPGMARDGEKGFVTFTNLYRPEARDDHYHQKFIDEAFTPALDAAKKRQSSAP